MNIILLSGGSGKRLWPLSNDIRSKQFIKMFKNDVGEYESMIQRVYRQVKLADNDANITIATGKSQVSSIKNQLNNKVSICVEPDRRDTFPAIALATTYLADEKGLDMDEAVLVCPVDPYVEDDYYLALKELFDLASNGDNNLNLMGVEPTYPSQKYGYIIPKTKDQTSEVSEFKEKPDEATAQGYINKGALWNCGVFAFKLGYLLDIAHKLIEFEDYYDLYQKYSNVEKISFDYAVVENEKSIGCMRFCGRWKDIGTWNTFTEEMDGQAVGNVIMDDTCKNTNVINELDIPILCMGSRDMIIATSGDGILISDKHQSSYIKPYVDRIEQPVMYAEKSWGSFHVIDVQEDSMTIKVHLKAGNKLKYHSHQHRNEVWTVIVGSGYTIVDGMKQPVKVGDVIAMDAGCKHTIVAESDLKVIEVQLGESIDINDKEIFFEIVTNT